MYHDLGPNHFDSRSKERQKNRLLKRLADLGYTVELAPLASKRRVRGGVRFSLEARRARPIGNLW